MEDSQQMQSGPIVAPPINEYGRIDAGSYLRHLMHAYSFALLIIQIIAMPGEVLLRRRFGERYLDPLMVILGFTGIFILGATVMAQEGSTNSVLIFSFGYAFLAIVHRLAILHRDLKGETWHSHNAGLSWPVLTLPSRLIANVIGRLPPAPFGEGYRERLKLIVGEYIQLFVEPILVAMAGGALIRQGGATLGNILPFIASAMLMKNVLEYHIERANMLDIVDAAIEAEHRADVLTGAKGQEEAHGYKVSGVRLPKTFRKMFVRSVPANDDRRITHESAQG